MSENNNLENEDLMNAINSVQEVKVGDVVRGEVLAIDENKQLIVAIIGASVEGVVPFKELSTTAIDNIEDVAKVGDELDLVVISSIGKDKENGSYLLSKRRIEARKIWQEIEEDFKANKIVEGTVTDVVKGGLVVDLGVRGFVPASMVENHFVSDFSGYKGQTLSFKIIEIEPSENRLILSHKAVVEEERKAAREVALAALEVGATVRGTVARLADFGAFVDLGGVDGLVHVSEISHDHIGKPSDVLKPGDEIDVKVLSIDPDKDRISLSIKATLPGPWDNIDEKIPTGAVLDGLVKRLTTFGAFVELYPGVEGLVHISQISHQHIATPHEVLQEGQEVKVKVIDVKPEERRVALSIKALEEKANEVEEEVSIEEYKMDEDEGGFTLGDFISSDSELTLSDSDE